MSRAACILLRAMHAVRKRWTALNNTIKLQIAVLFPRMHLGRTEFRASAVTDVAALTKL